ncbi:MAG: shikimate dehydrogenase [Lachnospiraceae bacterium]|nr:shikimate dehydrogenase [Lachnospiraceae bacterium]
MSHLVNRSDETTQLYALIGHPVAHSLSPKIHNAAFAALSLDAVYILADSAERGLEGTINYLLGEGCRGFNVTMPDKTAIIGFLDDLSLEARIGGAVNTVICRDGHLRGETSDGAGFLYALRQGGFVPEGRSMTLLGGGGAASSILIAAALNGFTAVDVYCRSDRSFDRMETAADRLSDVSSTAITIRRFGDTDALKQSLAAHPLLANATSVGMGPTAGCSPLDGFALPGELTVFDAIYHPARTLLLEDAEKAGCTIINGLPMLIGQAAVSFKLWTGLTMPVDKLPPLP